MIYLSFASVRKAILLTIFSTIILSTHVSFAQNTEDHFGQVTEPTSTPQEAAPSSKDSQLRKEILSFLEAKSGSKDLLTQIAFASDPFQDRKKLLSDSKLSKEAFEFLNRPGMYLREIVWLCKDETAYLQAFQGSSQFLGGDHNTKARDPNADALYFWIQLKNGKRVSFWSDGVDKNDIDYLYQTGQMKDQKMHFTGLGPHVSKILTVPESNFSIGGIASIPVSRGMVMFDPDGKTVNDLSFRKYVKLQSLDWDELGKK